MSDERAADAPPCVHPDEVLVVRRGPGANCSSVGSVLDILFLSAVAGGAILAGVAGAAGGGGRGGGARGARGGRAEADAEPEPGGERDGRGDAGEG